jgi:DNA-binding ferritin-like protein
MVKNPIEIYDDIKSGRIKLANDSSDSSKIEKKDSIGPDLLNKYLALLRVSYIVHQHSHWKCKGPNFYGNHKMFQKIYEKAGDKIDSVAEKIIGLYGNDSLVIEDQLPEMNNLCKYHFENFFKNSLDVEQDLIIMAEDVYNRIKAVGEMSLGLDDMLMSQINDFETSVYLIKQAMS